MQLFHLFTFPLAMAVVLLGQNNLENVQENRERILSLRMSLVPLALSFFLFTCVYVIPVGENSWYRLTAMTASFLSVVTMMLLEHSVFIRRIRESFFYAQYAERQKLSLAHLTLMLILLITTLVNNLIMKNPGTPELSTTFLLVFAALFFSLNFIISAFLYSFRKGIIQKNNIFLAAIPLIFLFLLPRLLKEEIPEQGHWLPLFGLINLFFAARAYQVFFARNTAYLKGQIRSLKTREVENNNLIRRVINSPEQEDRELIVSMVTEALEKSRALLVNPDYGISGITIYSRKDQLIRLEDRRLIIGHNAPLSRNLSLKNMTRRQVNETIFRQSINIDHVETTPLEMITDLAERLLKTCLQDKEPFIYKPLPPHLKGIQKLMAVYPIFNREDILALMVIFKDNFDQLYPEEEQELSLLADNLSVTYMLRRGKTQMAEQNRLKGEMKIAEKLQTSLVPRQIIMPHYDTAGFMEPANEVGGDIYDHKETPQGNFLALGDVSGHGLPAGIMAALQMAAFHGLLEGLQLEKDHFTLDQIYDGINRVLCTLNRNRMGSDRFMTLNYLQEHDGHFHHAGAHEIGLIFRLKTNEVEELNNMATGTGFMGLSEYLVSSQSLGEFTLNHGDILLLYSDGIIEAKNSAGEFFGLEKLKECLKKNCISGASEIIDAVRSELETFIRQPGETEFSSANLQDDITLLVVKRQ